ncbi:hypothetical protein CR513_52553, partial [Mucuna pruriens]
MLDWFEEIHMKKLRGYIKVLSLIVNDDFEVPGQNYFAATDDTQGNAAAARFALLYPQAQHLQKSKTMAKFLFLCFVLANTLLSLTMATNQSQIIFQSISAPSSNPPAQSPSSDQRTHTSTAKPSIGRKLGKHQHNQIRSSDTTSPTPSEAPQSEKKMHSEGGIPSHQRTSIEPYDEGVLGSEGKVHLLKQQHHHSFDKSIAGAGVILGGLATTFLVSVFCYIRATGRHKLETTA